jgi:hypothetical protein
MTQRRCAGCELLDFSGSNPCALRYRFLHIVHEEVLQSISSISFGESADADNPISRMRSARVKAARSVSLTGEISHRCSASIWVGTSLWGATNNVTRSAKTACHKIELSIARSSKAIRTRLCCPRSRLLMSCVVLWQTLITCLPFQEHQVRSTGFTRPCTDT